MGHCIVAVGWLWPHGLVLHVAIQEVNVFFKSWILMRGQPEIIQSHWFKSLIQSKKTKIHQVIAGKVTSIVMYIKLTLVKRISLIGLRLGLRLRLELELGVSVRVCLTGCLSNPSAWGGTFPRLRLRKTVGSRRTLSECVWRRLL